MVGEEVGEGLGNSLERGWKMVGEDVQEVWEWLQNDWGICERGWRMVLGKRLGNSTREIGEWLQKRARNGWIEAREWYETSWGMVKEES